MMLVDDRTGSAELAEPLADKGLDIEVERLDTGDFVFNGRGVDGADLLVGVERKRLDSSDFSSSLRSGRLVGEQLPKMLGPQGAFDHAWLVIEGQWKTDKFGRLLVLKHGYRRRHTEWEPVPGNLTTSEMTKNLTTLEVCGGLHIRFTDDLNDTVRFLTDLYRWYTDKAMDEHRSHQQVHRPLGFLRLSDFRETVSRFPGVGVKTSAAVEQAFGGSLRRAVNASVEDWAKIQTKDKKGHLRRLGVPTAERIVQWVKG